MPAKPPARKAAAKKAPAEADRVVVENVNVPGSAFPQETCDQDVPGDVAGSAFP